MKRVVLVHAHWCKLAPAPTLEPVLNSGPPGNNSSLPSLVCLQRSACQFSLICVSHNISPAKGLQLVQCR